MYWCSSTKASKMRLMWTICDRSLPSNIVRSKAHLQRKQTGSYMCKISSTNITN